jgi:hypothetical protein
MAVLATMVGVVTVVPQPASAAFPCGTTVGHEWYGYTVHYRHCTNGTDSVRVKAIVDFGPDGGCTTVGPNQEKVIHRYSYGVFSHIARC